MKGSECLKRKTCAHTMLSRTAFITSSVRLLIGGLPVGHSGRFYWNRNKTINEIALPSFPLSCESY